MGLKSLRLCLPGQTFGQGTRSSDSEILFVGEISPIKKKVPERIGDKLFRISSFEVDKQRFISLVETPEISHLEKNSHNEEFLYGWMNGLKIVPPGTHNQVHLCTKTFKQRKKISKTKVSVQLKDELHRTDCTSTTLSSVFL